MSHLLLGTRLEMAALGPAAETARTPSQPPLAARRWPRGQVRAGLPHASPVGSGPESELPVHAGVMDEIQGWAKLTGHHFVPPLSAGHHDDAMDTDQPASGEIQALEEEYRELLEAAKATIPGYREDGPRLGLYFDIPSASADLRDKGRKKIVFDSYVAEADGRDIKGVRKRSGFMVGPDGQLIEGDDEYQPIKKVGRTRHACMVGRKEGRGGRAGLA
jgi:hypothetical protein